ncbi:hypothetical protein FQN57_004566 [Myotisia sp. PD_48]|nr:hypothetical protein FQN57_004566 [Myotisia sp. PD_48]
METSLLFPASSDPASARRLASNVTEFLDSNPSRFPSFPLSIFSKKDTPELWFNYEQLFIACLRTSDDVAARRCLDRITARFGPKNERVVGLRGLYEEATAKDAAALETILKQYEAILAEDPVNVPTLKRRIALLRSLSRHAEAISALVQFLDAFPTDAEAWCELSDMYQSQGMSSQAIYCLEEALLIVPNGWNLHARLGELQYISTTLAEISETSLKTLAESVRRFCRSIELCDDYLRGYYGLHLSTTRLLERLGPKSNALSKSRDENFPSREKLEKLRDLSTKKLKEIVKTRCADVTSFELNQSELIAAQELLDKAK